MINRITAIVLLTTGLTTSSFAQNIRIKVDNTEPRLGQEINLTIETSFFEEFLRKSFSDSIEFKETYSNKDLTKTLIAKRLGPMTIGPMQFEFNGVTYSSNSLSINVIPNLTDKEGVWIRKLKIDSTDYILIEQITIIKPVTTGSVNSWNTEWRATEENLTRLIKEPKEEGIEFADWRSGMGQHPDADKDYSPSISYSYKFYEIKKGAGFKRSFKLKERHFENLPKGAKIPEIVIE